MMAKNAKVFIELKHLCIHHLIKTLGNHLDFTSMLAYPCKQSPLFTIEEGAFLRITINLLKQLNIRILQKCSELSLGFTLQIITLFNGLLTVILLILCMAPIQVYITTLFGKQRGGHMCSYSRRTLGILILEKIHQISATLIEVCYSFASFSILDLMLIYNTSEYYFLLVAYLNDPYNLFFYASQYAALYPCFLLQCSLFLEFIKLISMLSHHSVALLCSNILNCPMLVSFYRLLVISLSFCTMLFSTP